jgi:hypothetical protein
VRGLDARVDMLVEFLVPGGEEHTSGLEVGGICTRMINLPGVEYLWPLVPFGGRLPIVFRRHRREMSSQRHQDRLAILRPCDEESCQLYWRTW